MNMKKCCLLLTTLGLVGCEDTTVIVQTPDAGTVTTIVEPVSPRGTVTGLVLEGTLAPLEGVTVSIVTAGTGPRTTTTDANGAFAFTDVNAGAQVLVTYEKDGYAPFSVQGTVPSSSGNNPLEGGNLSAGPVVLLALEDRVVVQALAPDGRPAVGARGSLVVRQASYNLGVTSGVGGDRSVIATATAGATGELVFEGLPRPEELASLFGQYTLVIDAWDGNGDGVLDTEGLVRGYNASEIVAWGGQQRIERLRSAWTTGNLAVSHSTVPSLVGGSLRSFGNVLPPGGSIGLVFNQPVLPDSIRIDLTDEYGATSLPVTGALSVGNTQLAITPASPLAVGQEYNVRVRAVALNGTAWNGTGFVFGGTNAAAPAVEIASLRYQEAGPIDGRLETGELVEVHWNQVLFRSGVPSSVPQVYFGADLDGSGTIGDALGEKDPVTGRTLGAETGFALQANEPFAPVQTTTTPTLPIFNLASSGATTRYTFLYQGAAFDPTTAVPVFVEFSRLYGGPTVYENVWGVTVSSDFELTSDALVARPKPTMSP